MQHIIVRQSTDYQYVNGERSKVSWHAIVFCHTCFAFDSHNVLILPIEELC